MENQLGSSIRPGYCLLHTRQIWPF